MEVSKLPLTQNVAVTSATFPKSFKLSLKVGFRLSVKSLHISDNAVMTVR